MRSTTETRVGPRFHGQRSSKMPWDFPRKVPKVGEVLSYESFNDGIVYLNKNGKILSFRTFPTSIFKLFKVINHNHTIY